MNAARRELAAMLVAMTMAGALALLAPTLDAQPPPAAPTPEHAQAVAALQRAEQAVKSNDLATARRLLREFPEAHGSGDAQLESRRRFQLAVIDQLEAEQGPADATALLRRAAAGYSRVVELAPGAAAAHYNLGRVHQQLGNLELAAKAFESAAARPGKDQVFYLRMWAEFQGSAGRWQEAETTYQQVVFLEPRLEEPHRILSQRYLEQTERSSKLMGYLWRLVEEKQSARAEDLALTALERGWPEWTQAELLTVVAASLAERVRAPSDLAESPTGKRLAALAGNANVGKGVQQLLSLYAGPGVVAVGSLSWWTHSDLEWAHERGVPRGDAIRAVLRGIGDGYRERGETKIAAACYQAAIDASPSPDPLALRELVSVYVEQNQLQALNDLARRYADPAGALFAAKNEAYRTGQLETVLQYHRALGQIYGALALNNKVPWGDSRTPTTALFQLERAYRVGQELDREHPDSHGPKSSHVDPDLAALLATAYEAKGDTAAGNKVRLDAAERYTSKGDVRAKDKVLRNIPINTLTPEQIERYRRYEGVKEVTPRAPAATAAPTTDPVSVPDAALTAAVPKIADGGPPAIGPGGYLEHRSEATVLGRAAPGALIGKVGAVMFMVGDRSPGPAPASGRLFLSINDTPGKFGDNQGQVKAAVRVE